jgi:hypothetical protein
LNSASDILSPTKHRFGVEALLYCTFAGPAFFALFFCVNGAIHLYFFDSRADRPAQEYIVMLTAGEFFFFLFSYITNILAFFCLGLWLVGSNALRLNKWIAAVVFVPVMTYITCKLFFAWDPVEENVAVPDVVFGAAMLWEFPFRGFFLVLFGNIFAVSCCCWLLDRTVTVKNRTWRDK